MSESYKTIANNKKAFHEYFVLEKLECGISLAGTEVKSVRAGRVNLKDSFCTVDDGQLVVHGMHISPYEYGNIFNKDPLRNRVLLAHRKEIDRLYGCQKKDGLALVPLRIYFKGSNVKLEVGLCKGKKLYDKRADLKKKQANREIERSMKEQNR